MIGTRIHTADAVLAESGHLIRGGAVAESAGLIVAVGTLGDIRSSLNDDIDVVEWQGLIIPGLVNAHTHLQYSTFAEIGRGTYRSFEEWSIAFDNEYEARTNEDWHAAATLGARLALAAGTTCFGEVVTDEPAVSVLEELGLPGVAYFEIMGVDPERWASETAVTAAQVLEQSISGCWSHRGISPHAPYSLDFDVARSTAELARSHGRRLHTHLAESAAEDEYYRSATGPLVHLVREVIGWHWRHLDHGGSGVGAAQTAEQLGLLGPDCHIAHGIYLDDEGRQLLRDNQTAVALCPRSNLVIGLDPPPIADYLREESPIAIGTDSLASTPSLDTLEDAKLLRDLAIEQGYAEADLDTKLFDAATVGGAFALGMVETVGRLRPGMRADFAVFDIDPGDRPERAIVETGAGRCRATIVGGQARWTETGRNHTS